MPRKVRIDYPGLTHHVMARTSCEWKLFCDESDREFFVALLEKRVIESDCRCYAWSLMDTHYHLLIHTSEKPLWQLMKPLNTDHAPVSNADRTSEENHIREMQYLAPSPARTYCESAAPPTYATRSLPAI